MSDTWSSVGWGSHARVSASPLALCSLLPTMAEDREAAVLWLGRARRAPAHGADAGYLAMLLAGFDRDPQGWTLDDIPGRDGGMPLQGAEALWEACLTDCPALTGTKLLNADRVRFQLWLAAHYAHSGDESKVTSKEELEALATHGMDSPLELRRFELSLFLGRTVGDPELAEGAYRVPPSTMRGAVKSGKAGATNFDKILKEAEKAGSLTKVESYVINLAKLLSKSGPGGARDGAHLPAPMVDGGLYDPGYAGADHSVHHRVPPAICGPRPAREV